ncbi:MAG TPA: CvpA family protein [Candidatus Limnocylindrales bacterium]|nr:CvpA family protein [Candidatus Limnocylindrales bacterium]
MDAILVGFIAALIFGGWRTGFLRRLVGLVFVVLSFGAGAYLRYPIGAIARTFFKDIPPEYADLVGYTIAFPAVLGILHVVGSKTLSRISMTGLTKEVDALLGAIVGGVEAILILSAAIVILDAYFGTATGNASAPPGALRDLAKTFNATTTVHILRDTTVPVVLAILGPLLPKDLKQLVPNGLPTTGLPGGQSPGLGSFPLP